MNTLYMRCKELYHACKVKGKNIIIIKGEVNFNLKIKMHCAYF